ncbi:MAG: DUF2225 domain-containing protein [Methylobacter sp.]
MNDKYQDFLSKLQNANESERDWFVMEFSLQNLSETLRQAVWAAAVPHWFDQDFLNAVLANPLKDSDFQVLTELSFVEVYPERGFNVHERSRNLLLTQLWATNKTRYQKLSKRAAAYCKKQDQNIAAWRVETLYHGLLASNSTAKDDFIKQSVDWHNRFQFDNLENLTKVVLEAVGSGKLIGDVAAWAAFWHAQLDNYYSRYSSAQDFLRQALNQTANNLLVANCIYSLGEAYRYLSKYDQARDSYQQALPIFRKIKSRLSEANCILALGQVHLALAEYGQARERYREALPIFQEVKSHLGEANCIIGLGDVHCSLAEYDQAHDRYQQALLIYQRIKNSLVEANCIHKLGCLYSAQQQTELAIVTLQQAAQLYEVIGNKHSKGHCFNSLATLYQRQKQFTSALSAYNQAIEIFPNDTGWYQNRADLYIKMDDYEKAETDIKQTETISADPVYTLLRKAELALWQQQTPQAIEFCQQALEQRPADGNFRSFFALTLLANGQTQAAYTEMEQALTAIYQQHDFDELLDYLNKLAKIYGHSADVDGLRELILKRCQKD